MKILMICDFFPNKYKPYEGVFFLNHAKVLRKLGKIRVQTLIRVNKFKLSYERWNVEDIEVEAITFFYKPNFGFIFLPLALLFQFILTFKNLLFFKPDRVILQMALPQGLACLPFSMFRKYIVLEHSEKVLFGINRLFSKIVYNFSNGNFVVSTFQKDELENKLKIRVDGIIQNPIFSFNMVLDSNIKNRVIFVGTITDRKDPILILKTAKLLPGIEFVFVGRNFNDDYYKEFIKISNNLNNVKYLGPKKNHKEVLLEILNSDFLISTSKHEEFGVVIAEALSLGKPIIWTDSGGPRDFLNEKNSILVKERDENALKDAIIQAYKKLKGGYFNFDEIKKDIFNYCGVDKVLEAYKKALKL